MYIKQTGFIFNCQLGAPFLSQVQSSELPQPPGVPAVFLCDVCQPHQPVGVSSEVCRVT